WTEACDLFLAAGFISPARFAETVQELHLTAADMPDDLRRRLFVLVGVAADVGLDDLQSKTEDILCGFAPDESDDVRRVSFSAGTDVNIRTYAKWVSEHAARALVFRSARNALTDPRPDPINWDISPDGKTLATAGHGDDIQLWSLPSGEQIGTLAGHKTAVRALTFINGGRDLVSLGYEQSIKFWDTATWQEVRTVRSNLPAARGLAFSPTAELAAVSLEGNVQLWSVKDWTLLREFPVSTKVINGMAFSSDGQWLAVGAADKKIRVWELP
ncbi:MAG: hypothetical protein IIA60_10690, partial [Candidatus Marinimicrobia bacterium]|nr:hypothetical protein [Candidatus Neomarinimicrobiota bacterium]